MSGRNNTAKNTPVPRPFGQQRQDNKFKGNKSRDYSDTASVFTTNTGSTEDLYANKTLSKEEVILCKLWCANIVHHLSQKNPGSQRELLATIGNKTFKDKFDKFLRPVELLDSHKLANCLSDQIDSRLSIDRSQQYPYVVLNEQIPLRSISSTSTEMSLNSLSPGKGKEKSSGMNSDIFTSSSSSSSDSMSAEVGENVMAEESKSDHSKISDLWLTPPKWRKIDNLFSVDGKPYTLIAPLELKIKDYIRRVNEIVRDGICHLVEKFILDNQSDGGSAAAPTITNLTSALTYLQDHSEARMAFGLVKNDLDILEQGCFTLVEMRENTKCSMPKLFKSAEIVLLAFAPMSKEHLLKKSDSVKKSIDELKLLKEQFNYHGQLNRRRGKVEDAAALKFDLADVIPKGEQYLTLHDQVYSLANMIKTAADNAMNMTTFELPMELNVPIPTGSSSTATKTIVLPEELRTDPFLPGLLMAEAERIQGMSLDELVEEVKSLYPSKSTKEMAKAKTKEWNREEFLTQFMVDGRALESVDVEHVNGDNDSTIALSFHYTGDFKEFSKETPEKQQEFVGKVCQRLEEVTGIPLVLQLINPEGTALRSIEVCEGSVCVMFILARVEKVFGRLDKLGLKDYLVKSGNAKLASRYRRCENWVSDINDLNEWVEDITGNDLDVYLSLLIDLMPNINSWIILLIFVIVHVKVLTSRRAT